MKLLVLTQKVDNNDDLLGFFHSWLAEFARHCQLVTVICLQAGEVNLPANVRLFSLGKEKAASAGRWRLRLGYLFRLYKYLRQERQNYDFVFVHMNTEYVLLAGWYWRLAGKKIGLWHAHKVVHWRLRLAARLADIIFTSTPEGCRLKSKKIKVVGQGIDTNKFKIQNSKLKIKNPKTEIKENELKIITVGRISPIKDYETLLKAVAQVKSELAGSNFKISFNIIGTPATKSDREYERELKQFVQAKKIDKVVNFLGAVPNKNIVQYLQAADLFISASRTGSLDKAILEAMACGLPPITSNQAAQKVLKDYPQLLFAAGDSRQLANKIKEFLLWPPAEKFSFGQNLRQIVKDGHSLAGLIKNIVNLMQNYVRD